MVAAGNGCGFSAFAESGAPVLPPSSSGGHCSLKGTEFPGCHRCAWSELALRGAEVGGREAVWLLSDLFPPQPPSLPPLLREMWSALPLLPPRGTWLENKRVLTFWKKERGGLCVVANCFQSEVEPPKVQEGEGEPVVWILLTWTAAWYRRPAYSNFLAIAGRKGSPLCFPTLRLSWK